MAYEYLIIYRQLLIDFLSFFTINIAYQTVLKLLTITHKWPTLEVSV